MFFSVVFGAAAAAQEEPAVDFQREIQPIFAKWCFACHGPDTGEGGLRLHHQATALAELDSGERAIVPGDVERSVLLERVSEEDEFLRMPPEGEPLSESEISLLRRWIKGGAEWAKHWAFEPPLPQTPPQVKDERWITNPIDAFILHRLEAANLKPAPPADKVTLIRRAYYDLTGLPPSPAEVDAFVADDAPHAYEELIDRLLDSPQYGERWARHWLDVVRFAETNSFERDGVKPNAWRYRDYVIRSFNEDKPYDRFILEQLAGDELPDRSRETIIATGFYRLGLWDDEPADPLQAKYDELDDIITTTSHGFLGVTIDCARCHDHKIDPIPQTDYYQMVAFFADLRPYGTRGDQRSWNQTDISPPEVAAKHEVLDARQAELRREMTEIEERGIVKMPAEDQRKTEGRERDEVLAEKLEQYLSEDDWRRYSSLKENYEGSVKAQRRLPPRESALSVAMCLAEPPPTHVLQRGNPHVPGEKVSPGYPELFGAEPPTIPPPPEDAESAGRRLVLARWIASPENRLTARVMVNRIWQHHFGRGIVRSPNNFGQGGDPPTHPRLLDWLARDFVQGGWRMKRMHKQIMMSSSYRMSSAAAPEALAKDPNNDLFWRFNMRRLSAEEIRDSIHAVSGELNLKMYGPGIYPELSQEVLAGQSRPGDGWGASSRQEQARRSIYIHVKRSLIPPSLANFDFPETDRTCEARFNTTIPQQALGMLNGDFI
ncbi:MAG: PSD1 and planctomycete cytochrome C domain-containing protein, partial [Planctomycetes bacterium]|nr:PSD1 and planctomycete cytochrome C domain-containing protein [Planctomycetota bacterium]